MRRGTSLVALAILLAGAPAPVRAAPAKAADRDAAYLEETFRHDLCTRGDRALRTLNRALGRKPASPRH